jgi:hypothetical protein
VVDQGRVSTPTDCVTAALPLRRPVTDLRRGWVWLREYWVRCRLRYDQANGENAARSARAPLKNGAAVRGSRLKIATDVVSVLGLSEAPVKTGRSFSLARMEVDGVQRGTLVQLRARWD